MNVSPYVVSLRASPIVSESDSGDLFEYGIDVRYSPDGFLLSPSHDHQIVVYGEDSRLRDAILQVLSENIDRLNDIIEGKAEPLPTRVPSPEEIAALGAARERIAGAMAYRGDGELGSQVRANLYHLLGLRYGEGDFDAALAAADRRTIERMLDHLSHFFNRTAA